MKVGKVNISWLGHAGFVLQTATCNIYIDPYQISRGSPEADYVFLTHDHYDHLSVEDIDQIIGEDTIIICPNSCREKITHHTGKIILAKPGDEKDLDDLSYETLPAYNLTKPFHPKDRGWIGYIITIQGTRIYHAGDSDFIPEMKGVEADVALLPVSGTYVMTPQEAAKAADTMKVKQVIPMHWGAIIGDKKNAEEFKKLVKKAKVTVLEKTIF